MTLEAARHRQASFLVGDFNEKSGDAGGNYFYSAYGSS